MEQQIYDMISLNEILPYLKNIFIEQKIYCIKISRTNKELDL